MPNLSEFEEFVTRSQSLVNQPVYHDEFVYPGLVIEQAGRQWLQITPPLGEALQFLQYNLVERPSPETCPTIDELEISPVTARVERHAIHVESLGKSMCLVTIPGGTKMQVITGADWWDPAVQLMKTDPDATATQQVLLSLVFEGED
ncbi:hypothetical protein NG796_24600 [Laspinema sp. A4]|uniref:hypothetical protein n=1 Tax=Laspinema sp. D2d TaxID=2953686 RepID=UPI0021BAEAE8|nr:hypothetical protein [Laspinema sp. D2d]MCT7986456.1 hypothetical protein [Laspinema sp. D2d]